MALSSFAAFCILIGNILVYSMPSTTGHYFQRTDDGEEGIFDNDEPFIKPGFHKCGDTNNCSRVLEKNTVATKEHPNADNHPEEVHTPAWSIIRQSTDCKDLYKGGRRFSGIYYIIRQTDRMLIKVYCDMDTDGGGWTVIQRRVDGSTDFNRNWSDYKHGFGDLGKNMWIGLENMHFLANPGSSTTLRVELKHWAKGDQLFYAKYDSFQIGNEADSYRIRVSGYSGTAGDAFNVATTNTINNSHQFYTKDSDNVKNCSAVFKGGWWYNQCHNCYLNGMYPDEQQTLPMYMSWRNIDSQFGNIYFSEMKLRRN